METNYKILEWDTQFFGFHVARIIPDQLKEAHLSKILEQLKSQNVKLVYWLSDSQNEESQIVAGRLGGSLVDVKTTYVASFPSNSETLLSESNNTDFVIEEYTELVSNQQLDHLAIQSGIFSRFNKDTRISKDKFEALYKLWILNSINKTLASAVFIARENRKIVGLITLGSKNGRGDIGLVAVSEEMRNRRIGFNLIQAGHKWFIERRFTNGQVVTQAENHLASKLYRRCGYRLEKSENFYHFWLFP